MSAPTPLVLLAEVASTLAEYGRLLVIPSVEHKETTIAGSVTVTLHISAVDGLAIGQLSDLYHAIQRIHDLGLIRALAATYDIDPEKLEALLPKELR